MIFVAVGTQKFPFDRLLSKLDSLLESGEIQEEVFAQTGHSLYAPRHYPFQPFIEGSTFTDRIQSANLVVLHSGDGTILDALRRGKKVVVVPRLAKYGEHIDNHQLEIARAFHDRGLVEGCWDIDDLGACIRRATERDFPVYERKSDIEFILENFLTRNIVPERPTVLTRRHLQPPDLGARPIHDATKRLLDVPMLSIIVPIYNAEKKLLRTLDSIRSQTFRDFECILVDDGSKDSSPSICERTCAEDPRFRLVSQPNGGVSAARNTGLEHAKGRWIGWVDADDTASPNMFRTLVEEAVRHDADIVCCNFERVQADGRVTRAQFQPTDVIDQFLRHPVYMHSLFNKLYRGDAIRALRFDTSLTCCEDLLVNAVLFERHRKVRYVDEHLYSYFENPESITKSDPHLRHQNSRERSCVLLEQALGAEGPLSSGSRRLVAFRKLNARVFYLKNRVHRDFDAFRELFPESNPSLPASRLHPGTRLAGLLALARLDGAARSLLELGDRGLKKTLRIAMGSYWPLAKSWITFIRGGAGLRPKAFSPDLPAAPRTFSIPGHHLFFGYYDLQQIRPDLSRMLVHKVLRGATPVSDPAGIGWIDLGDGSYQELATTRAWCWQQGSRLRWADGDSTRILFNDVEGDTYCTRILDAATPASTPRTVPHALYDVTRDLRSGLSCNFSRLQRLRPGYGYLVLPDRTEGRNAPNDDGVFHVDLGTGERRLLHSLESLARPVDPDLEHEHYVNHISIAPGGGRFLFFHVWNCDRFHGWMTRLMVSNMDGSDLRCLEDCDLVSHYAWRGDETILITGFGARKGFYRLYDWSTGKKTPIDDPRLARDGHPTFVDDDRFVSDTYPDGKARQQLFLHDLRSSSRTVLADLHSDPFSHSEQRCDLHPRFHPTSGQATIDTTCQHRLRQVMLFDLPGTGTRRA